MRCRIFLNWSSLAQGCIELAAHIAAFDFWVDTLASGELEIEDADESKERVRLEVEIRQLLKDSSTDARMKFAKTSYQYFLDNRERIEAVVKQYQFEGKTLT